MPGERERAQSQGLRGRTRARISPPLGSGAPNPQDRGEKQVSGKFRESELLLTPPRAPKTSLILKMLHCGCAVSPRGQVDRRMCGDDGDDGDDVVTMVTVVIMW